jgi:hypothetical protein
MAMGSFLSPVIRVIFVEYFETQALVHGGTETFTVAPKRWRYICDLASCFGPFTGIL